MTHQTYEGTWEEITAHAKELAGKQVRLTVLEEESMADIARRTRKKAEERGLTDKIFQQLIQTP